MFASRSRRNISFFGAVERYDTVTLLKAINIILVVVFLIVGIFAIRGFFAKTPVFASGLEFEEKITADEDQPAAILAADHYVDIVKKKQLFKVGVEPQRDRVSTGAKRMTIQELVAPLSLVGIIGGDEPVALINDSRSGKSFSLKAGEYLDALLIKEITPNSVTLSYENESMELKL